LNLSINQVADRLDPGEEFAGWQLPTLPDVEELMLNANIPYPTSPPNDQLGSLPGFNQAISDFLDIYGAPSDTDVGDQAEIWIQTGSPVPVVRMILSDGEYGNLNAHRADNPPAFVPV
tara:strand:- start:12 stop:365 length:354 start_codon:yes stop_codon:yes gene_type:complete